MTRTVARILERILFRVTLVGPVPADRNRPDVLQRRQEFGNSFMNHAIFRPCVFIDEYGYNIWTAEITGGRGRMSVHIDKYAASEDGTAG